MHSVRSDSESSGSFGLLQTSALRGGGIGNLKFNFLSCFIEKSTVKLYCSGFDFNFVKKHKSNQNKYDSALIYNSISPKMPPDTPDIVASLTQAQIEAKAKSDRVISELQLLAAQYTQRDFNRHHPILT